MFVFPVTLAGSKSRGLGGELFEVECEEEERPGGQTIGGRIDGGDPGRHWTFGQVVDRIHDPRYKEEAQVGEPIRGGWIRCERFRLERSDERTVPE